MLAIFISGITFAKIFANSYSVEAYKMLCLQPTGSTKRWVAPNNDTTSTKVVQRSVFAFKRCGALRKNKHLDSKIFTLS
jgi:hypothetical protein